MKFEAPKIERRTTVVFETQNGTTHSTMEEAVTAEISGFVHTQVEEAGLPGDVAYWLLNNAGPLGQALRCYQEATNAQLAAHIVAQKTAPGRVIRVEPDSYGSSAIGASPSIYLDQKV